MLSWASQFVPVDLFLLALLPRALDLQTPSSPPGVLTSLLLLFSCWVVVVSLCDPMDCSPPGSSVHGNSQARILEWVAISFSKGPSQPRYQTGNLCVSCIGRQILYSWDTGEAWSLSNKPYQNFVTWKSHPPLLTYTQFWGWQGSDGQFSCSTMSAGASATGHRVGKRCAIMPCTISTIQVK